MLTGYVPQAFKAAEMKPLLKKKKINLPFIQDCLLIIDLCPMSLLYLKFFKELLQLNFVIICTEIVCLKRFRQDSEHIIAQRQYR